jgi:uncharacterized membrane protein HdeD (DUF308 family)
VGTAPSTMPGFGAMPQADAELADAMRRGRRRLLVAGVLALVLGAVAIAVPAIASVATAIFIGWILIVASGLIMFDAFAVQNGRRRLLRVLLGVLTFAAGLYLVVAPLDGTFTLTVMLVIWFVAVGTARIVIGIAEHGVPGWGMTVASGSLAVILGVLIAEQLPESADWAVGLIVGVDLLFAGVALVMLSRTLARLAEGVLR